MADGRQTLTLKVKLEGDEIVKDVNGIARDVGKLAKLARKADKEKAKAIGLRITQKLSSLIKITTGRKSVKKKR